MIACFLAALLKNVFCSAVQAETLTKNQNCGII